MAQVQLLLQAGRLKVVPTLPLDEVLKRELLDFQMKVTVALGWGRRAVVSPHLGDMDTPRGVALLRQTVEDLQALYGVQAELLYRKVGHSPGAGSAGSRGCRGPVRSAP